MKSRPSPFPRPSTAWRTTLALIPVVVVILLAAMQSASAATSLIPFVSTGPVVNLGSGSAVVSGILNSNGEAATYQFDYGTSTNYTSHTVSELTVDTTPDSVYGLLTGLTPHTVYHYRIEAMDAWGTNFGADQTFTSAGGNQSLSPVVATGAASGVGTESATIAGTVNPNGTATTYRFDYGTSTTYTSQEPAGPEPSAGSGTTAQTESATLTGLSPNTVYHYRIEATNAWGTSYGADQTLTTRTSGGSPPFASFTATSVVIHNKCGFVASFNATGSYAPGGPPIQYAWNFGDGSSAITTSPLTGHSYHAGSYTVVLTVSDAAGVSAPAERSVSGGSGSLYCS